MLGKMPRVKGRAMRLLSRAFSSKNASKWGKNGKNRRQRPTYCLFSFPISCYSCLMDEYEILLVWDDEARVWVAENDDIPVALESDSLDALIEQVRIAVPELLELNGKKYANVALNFKMERQTVMA